MAKTKPIGVRFDENFLDQMKADGVADTYQKAVNFLCKMYTSHKQKEGDELQEEIVFTPTPANGFDAPMIDTRIDEPFYNSAPREPKENTAAFIKKYGVCNYEELKEKLKNNPL